MLMSGRDEYMHPGITVRASQIREEGDIKTY
jgi:hypothetical protein